MENIVDNEIKTKWIEALRSGKYERGLTCLRDANNQYCCLGVLADIIDPEGWIKKTDFVFSHKLQNTRGAQYLSSKVLNEKIQTDLACMNDSNKYEFPAIADYIEENL